MKLMRPQGYSVSLAGRLPEGRESWSASCACGWYIHGQVSREAAHAALRRHNTSVQHRQVHS